VSVIQAFSKGHFFDSLARRAMRTFPSLSVSSLESRVDEGTNRALRKPDSAVVRPANVHFACISLHYTVDPIAFAV
jgi:hypothetical protein